MPKISTPITRNNLFYSDEDFQLEVDIVMGYMEEDTNQTVVVYEVDRTKTIVNDIYQESVSNIRFKPPTEIPCLYEIQDNQLMSYDSQTNTGVYSITGNLKIYVLEKTFTKYKCDIRRGDYLGIQIDTDRMVYFSVVNDGKVNTSNQMVIGAYKTAWRVIEASPCTLDEFNGK